MKIFFFVYVISIFGSLMKSEIFAYKSHTTCKNKYCANKSYNALNKSEKLSYNASGTEIPGEFHFANFTDELSEKEIYMVANSEQSLISFNNYNNIHEFQTESTIFGKTSGKLPTSSIENIGNPERLNITTFGPLELTEVITENASSPTDLPLTEAAVTKSHILTTNLSPSVLQFVSKQNLIYRKNICFCDLKINQCDINCCCDEDCSHSHFKVFTKCIDDHSLYDTNFCFKSNIIFANNTSHKTVQKDGGLFCIVRENLKVNFSYKTKPIITSLEDFNKSLQEKLHTFSYKTEVKTKFTTKKYSAGSPVWTLQNGEMMPFKILSSSVGLLCNSEVNIKYLLDQKTVCSIHIQGNKCPSEKIKMILHKMKSTEIISSSTFINVTEKLNMSKICESKACIHIIPYMCQSFGDTYQCLKVSENSTNFFDIGCWNVLSQVQYIIWHNGSEGIAKLEAYLWLRKLTKISVEFFSLLNTEVKYIWVDSSKEIFKRSGNPGYLTGKPIIAGRKIYNAVNGTADKKEAIEVSTDPKSWLSVPGSLRGLCSFKERIPLSFKENGQYMCSLKLSKDYFNEEKCPELQNNIFKLLIGQDMINITKENYFNKFVAAFGNSRVEETGDWVQVLMDLYPLISSQSSFKANHYHAICKNIITDLYIDVVYSNIGSILAPQAKILGVAFYFGKHKDLTYQCDSPGCKNTSLFQYFQLRSFVHFIDITEPAVDAFAEPLYLETKLPHNFFYPFFSKGYKYQVLKKYFLILILLAFM